MVSHYEFRPHGSDKVTARRYVNNGMVCNVGTPFTNKSQGRWRIVYVKGKLNLI